MVEARDAWSATAIERLFAGWYLTPDGEAVGDSSTPRLVIGSSERPPQISGSWHHFEIAGGGTCYIDGESSYIDIDGSIAAIGAPGLSAIEVWMNGPLEIQSPVLTRVVTYALAAALRRQRLFELHSGAVIDPNSEKGVLIIGPSGSGKSTLTVQLALEGWPFLTDDVLLLSEESLGINAWPLRRCFAITPETFAASSYLRVLPSLAYLDGQENEKKQFVPHGIFAAEFRGNCDPRTLFFTELSEGDSSTISPLSASETMARLIRMNPWSCYDRTTAADHLAVLSRLVRQATAYSLRAGKDLLDPEFAAGLVARYARA